MGLPSVMGEAFFCVLYKAFTPLLRLWQKGRKCACVVNITGILYICTRNAVT